MVFGLLSNQLDFGNGLVSQEVGVPLPVEVQDFTFDFYAEVGVGLCLPGGLERLVARMEYLSEVLAVDELFCDRHCK